MKTVVPEICRVGWGLSVLFSIRNIFGALDWFQFHSYALWRANKKKSEGECGTWCSDMYSIWYGFVSLMLWHYGDIVLLYPFLTCAVRFYSSFFPWYFDIGSALLFTKMLCKTCMWDLNGCHGNDWCPVVRLLVSAVQVRRSLPLV